MPHNQKIFDEGWKAWTEGVDENPYLVQAEVLGRRDNYEAWRDGWHAAESDEMRQSDYAQGQEWHNKAVDGATREAMLRAIAERDAAYALLRRVLDGVPDHLGPYLTDDITAMIGDAPTKWRRVNNDPFEYAIRQGQHGDEFVRATDGLPLRRAIR